MSHIEMVTVGQGAKCQKSAESNMAEFIYNVTDDVTDE